MSLCVQCGDPIAPGSTIVQFANGVLVGSHETPTYDRTEPVIGEWHFECWDFGHPESEWPYRCQFCFEPIPPGAEVSYASVGEAARPPHIRPEHRNPTILHLLHRRCFEDWASHYVPDLPHGPA
jgi:hypothetical protein